MEPTDIESQRLPGETDEEWKRRKNREKTRRYRERHPESVEAANRAAREKKRVFVTDPAERKEMLADPRKALRKTDVVCLVCWQALPGMLNNAHLKQHGLTAAQYKAAPEEIDGQPVARYSRSTALVSQEMARKLSARRRGDTKALAERGKEALKPFQRPGRTQGPLSLQTRLERSDARTGVARPDLTAVPSCEIIWRWLIENKPTPQIARETGLDKDTIHRRLRVIFGLHPHAQVVRAHGEMVSDVWLEKMMQRFGEIYRSQVAVALGLPSSRLYSVGRIREGLALVPSQAEKLVALERKVMGFILLTKDSKPQHFAAMVPDLADKVDAARQGIAVIRDVLDDEEKQRAEVETLCAAAQHEELRARSIVLWLPELLDWVRDNRSLLYRKPYDLALEFVAHDFGVKGWVIQRALGTTPTPVQVIHGLAAGYLRSFPVKKKPGRPKEPNVKARIRLVAAFVRLERHAKDFARHIYPDRHDDSAFDALRRFMSNHRDTLLDAVNKMPIETAESIVKPFETTT